MPGDRLVYNVPEAAAVLGVSERTITRMAAEKKIPHQRIRSRLLFPKKALARWVEEQAEASMKPPERPST